MNEGCNKVSKFVKVHITVLLVSSDNKSGVDAE